MEYINRMHSNKIKLLKLIFTIEHKRRKGRSRLIQNDLKRDGIEN